MDISGFSSQSSVVTFLQSASSNQNIQNHSPLGSSSSKGNALLDLLEKANPEKAAELRKEQGQVNSIIQRLESSRIDLQDRIKSAASEKLARIKEQIALLKMTGGADPAATARQVARLAKELAGAASDYANASAFAKDALSSPAIAESLAAGQTVTVTTSETTEVTVSTLTIELPAEGKGGPTEGIVEAAERQIAELAQKQSAAKADEKFLADARRALDDLKQILAAAKKQLEQQEGGISASSEQDIKSAESSFENIGRSLGSLSISIASVSISTTTTVSISA